MDTFSGERAQEAARKLREESAREKVCVMRVLSKEYKRPIRSIEDIYRLTEENLSKSNKCKLCNKQCNSAHQLHIHMGSDSCMKRQSEANGKEYTAPVYTIRCYVCDIKMSRSSLTKHKLSVAHKTMLQKKKSEYHCLVCDKPFLTKRKKRSLIRHCKSFKHIAKLENPALREVHDFMFREYQL
jgi:hypothetical protein